MIYPFVVLSAALSIIAFLLLYLFPKIVPVFLSLHKELPLSTRVVIAVSGFLKEWWLFLGGGIFLLALGAVFLMRKNPNARRARDYVLVRVPFLGRLVREQILAQSMRTLGLLLKSGVALPESLDATAAAVQNCAYRESFETFASRARHGERIADAFKEEPFLFPEICAQMTAVGERSGNLSESFLYLSDLYERETEESLARFSGALEPALMVSMGLMVGFIAISIITPIYGITQNLHP